MRTKYVARVLAVLSTALLLLGLIAIPASADAATGSMTGPVYGHLDPQTDTFPKLSGVVVTVVPANDENAPPVGTATTDATGSVPDRRYPAGRLQGALCRQPGPVPAGLVRDRRQFRDSHAGDDLRRSAPGRCRHVSAGCHHVYRRVR